MLTFITSRRPWLGLGDADAVALHILRLLTAIGAEPVFLVATSRSRRRTLSSVGSEPVAPILIGEQPG